MSPLLLLAGAVVGLLLVGGVVLFVLPPRKVVHTREDPGDADRLAAGGPERADARRPEPGVAAAPAAAPSAPALPAGAAAEIVALARAGQRIEAIKRYRELVGGSLADAKATVDAMAAGELPGAGVEAPAGAAVEAVDARGAPGDADAQVAGLVAEGRLIEAVKLYRDTHGVGLKEAKQAVDLIRAGVPPARVPARRVGSLVDEVYADLDRGDLIGAIKRYREATGCDLRTAKDEVEAIRDRRA